MESASHENKPEIPTLAYAPARVGRFQALCRRAPVNERRRGLKLWAAVTICLYLAACTVLFLPIATTLFGKEGEVSVIASALLGYEFWAIAAILVVAQILMLAVPVRASWDYQIKPRRLMVPLVAASVLMAVLTAGTVVSLLTLPFSDDPPTIAVVVAGAVVLASWLLWYLLFASCRHTSPDAVISHVQKRLLQGSIVELIVALGCHIWVRRRGDCSAPILTFWAICAGFVIMLLAFGPSVFYLFVARSRKMRPRSAD